jgi:hypothetical protein
VEALNASLNQVQSALDKEDFPAAQTQARAIHEKSQAISAEIEQALTKIGKKKPSPPRAK